MKESNVLNLEFHRQPRIADDLIAEVDEAIGALLAATIDVKARRKLSQALVHLHEARLVLSREKNNGLIPS